MVPTLLVQPSTVLKKLNINCWIRIWIPNPNPDPDWRFESGSTRIRNTDRNSKYLPTYLPTYQTLLYFSNHSTISVLRNTEMSHFLLTRDPFLNHRLSLPVVGRSRCMQR